MVGWLRYVLWVVVAVAGSWVMVTPILAHVFGTVALTGAIANLTVVPVCGVVLLLTCAAIPFLYIAPVIASVPLYIARALVDVTFGITEVCKSLPFASISGVHFPAAAVVVWYGALLGIACYVRARARGLEWTPTTRLFAALSAALAAAVWFAWVSLTPRDLRVTFLDVGHGQCCVIEAPSGRTILVDAGRAGRSTQGQRLADDVILPFLASRRVRNVDAIVITHPDADHCNAIERVIREIPCGVVLESFPDPDSTVYARLADAAVELGVPVRRISAGGQISLGSELRTQVLWPPANVPSELYDDNDRSAVLMLTHGRIRMLLTGDIENEAEHAIQRRGWPLAATVLQVPHHGGASSLGRTFLRQVRPDAAVVSCAEADAHHPHPVTIDRLRQASVRTWRTDLDGAVTLISDGETVRVRSQVARSRAQTEVLTGAGPRAALPGLAAP